MPSLVGLIENEVCIPSENTHTSHAEWYVLIPCLTRTGAVSPELWIMAFKRHSDTQYILLLCPSFSAPGFTLLKGSIFGTL